MLAVLIYGLTAIAAQITLVRELLASFYGNELTIGIVMSVWLIATAAGSAAAERKKQLRSYHLASVQIAIAVMAPVSLVISRLVRGAVGMQGQIFAPWQVLLLSLVSIGPICFLLGFCFTALLRAFGETDKGALQVSRVYYLEAIGAAVAGLLISYLLLPLGVAGFTTMMCLVTLGLVASWMSLRRPSRHLLLPLAAIALLVTFIFSPHLESASSRLRWLPFRLIEEKNSRYGLLSAVSSDGEVSIFESGLFSFAEADDFTPELISHVSTLQHDDPTRVLLLGGGVSGIVEKLHVNPLVDSIIYVEANDELIRLARKLDLFDPSRYGKLRIVRNDPRLFLAEAGCGYDVVISAAPDPVTAQFNRFYTLEFFEEVRAVLNPGGVFATFVTSSENFLNPSQAALISSIAVTLRHVFPEVLTTPGAVAVMLASSDPLTRDRELLVKRLAETYPESRFVTEGYLRHLFDPDRLDFMKQIQSQPPAIVNSDIHPKCYLYALLLQQSRVRTSTSAFAQAIFANGISLMILLLLVVSLGPLAVTRPLRLGTPTPAGLFLGACALTGFIQMAATIAIMISFQSLRGYVYYQISILVTAAMVGLASGGATGHYILTTQRRLRAFLLLDQLVLLLVMVALWIISARGAVNDLEPIGFAGLTFAVSFMGGLQFPLLARSLFPAGAMGGILYSFDLLGAAIGAAGVTLIMIPVLGFPGCWMLMSLVAFAGLLMLTIASRVSGDPSHL
jgi:spermidine synthase